MSVLSVTWTFACLLALPAMAQWLNQPTPGIPRTADGKPNLAAPAPRTADGRPDLTGLWRRNPKYALNITQDLKAAEIAPWVRALAAQRTEDHSKDYMGVLCLPAGPVYATSADTARFLQTPSMVAILHNDLTYRQIFMDGRKLEADPNPTWMGYSVGHWDGDTLVVESNGFNDRTWLDVGGHGHTEQLRTVERYRRLSIGRMELELTLTDPGAYTRPWTVKVDLLLAPDTEMIEYVCNENEKDRNHMVGKASDEKNRAIPMSPETMAQYVGNYRLGGQLIGVRLSEGELALDVGAFVMPLVPLSETVFSSPFVGRVDFAKDEQGRIANLTIDLGTGDGRAARVP